MNVGLLLKAIGQFAHLVCGAMSSMIDYWSGGIIIGGGGSQGNDKANGLATSSPRTNPASSVCLVKSNQMKDGDSPRFPHSPPLIRLKVPRSKPPNGTYYVNEKPTTLFDRVAFTGLGRLAPATECLIHIYKFY